MCQPSGNKKCIIFPYFSCTCTHGRMCMRIDGTLLLYYLSVMKCRLLKFILIRWTIFPQKSKALEKRK